MASPRPFDHLTIWNPNQGPDGCSTEGGPGLFSTGGDFCFQYGAIKNATEDWSTEEDLYEQFLTAIETGDYEDAVPTRKFNWVMKDNKRPFSQDNLDWEKTEPRYHPSPRTKKQRLDSDEAALKRGEASSTDSSSSSPSSTKSLPRSTIIRKTTPQKTTMDVTMSEDDNDDAVSLSSSDACMMRALNGETFDDEYMDVELSATSSSGTSSDESLRQVSKVNVSKNTSSPMDGTSSPFVALQSLRSSPFDVLRSSPATNMVSDYMSTLAPPDESINLTRSYAIPVRPSKKKPVMKFTPTNQINGVDLSSFVNALQKDDPTSGEKIEVDDDAASANGQYIEMDLALGVLEEKDTQDIALRPKSSSTSSEESIEDEDVGAIDRLNNIASKSSDVKGKKAVIQEL